VVETAVEPDVERVPLVETEVERVPLAEAEAEPEAEPEVEGPEAEPEPPPEEPVLGPVARELEPLPPPLPPPEFADVCAAPEPAAEPLECELEPDSLGPPEPLSELEEHAASATTATVDNRREGDLMTKCSSRCGGLPRAVSKRTFFVERIWMT
jgi:hypothetical protein